MPFNNSEWVVDIYCEEQPLEILEVFTICCEVLPDNTIGLVLGTAMFQSEKADTVGFRMQELFKVVVSERL